MGSLNWGELVKEAGDSGKTFEPLPDGDYQLRILEAPNSVSGNGKTMFSVKAEVISGSYAKRFVWDNLVVSPESPGAMGFFFRKMEAIGLGTDFFQREPSPEQVASALKGRTFIATIGRRTGQYANKNEIKAYRKDPSGVQAPGGAPAPGQPPVPQNTPAPPPAAPAAPPASPWDNAPAAPPAPAGFEAPPAPPF